VASVEIMIVVLGIFISLQVDDWNGDKEAIKVFDIELLR